MTAQIYINNHLSHLTEKETREKVSQMLKDAMSDKAKDFYLDCLLILNK